MKIFSRAGSNVILDISLSLEVFSVVYEDLRKVK